VDTSIIVAIVTFAGAVGAAALALFGQRSKYPTDFVDDVAQDNVRLRQDVERLRTDLNIAHTALETALARNGVLEAQARPEAT
jgi:hypothetical protein